jgi:type VI secretion system protein ImpA
MSIDDLLMPVPGSAPCGEDLSFSTEFDEIAEMRREDDPTLDQGEWVTALKVADWPRVQGRCSELLAQRSKDLRLAMWWTEAATHIDGYAGLKQGLELCAQLCSRYWNALHPLAENGDMEQRAGNIGWLLGRLRSLSTAPAVARAHGGAYSLRQWAAARALQAALDRSPDKTTQAVADALTVDTFDRALRDTPKEQLRQSLTSLESCRQALKEWQTVIDANLGADGPSFAQAREALDAAHHELQHLAREAGALGAAVSASATGTATLADAVNAVTVPRIAGAPLSREQALDQLRAVAAFFRATEPHSPVAYLADKAVQWGDMPLHLWLRCVLKDSAALAHVEDLLGLPPQGPTQASQG